MDKDVSPFLIYYNAWIFQEQYSYQHKDFSEDNIIWENFPFYKTPFL